MTDAYGPCPSYHYCGSDVGRGSVCLPGTNQVAELTQTQSDCDDVAAGFYSNTIIGYGSGSTMNVTECDPGYYCNNNEKQGSNVG